MMRRNPKLHIRGRNLDQVIYDTVKRVYLRHYGYTPAVTQELGRSARWLRYYLSKHLELKDLLDDKIDQYHSRDGKRFKKEKKADPERYKYKKMGRK